MGFAVGLMNFVVFGLSHQSADVALREQVALRPEVVGDALSSIQEVLSLEEAAILSTCNRTEIYASGNQASCADLKRWLSQYCKLSEAHLSDAYFLQGADAIAHMMRVAAGLDSLVLGEPQILGQLKDAYHYAQREGALGRELHQVFQQVFSTAKRIRSETAIGKNPVSVAYAAVSLAQQIFADLSECHVLVLGAGDTANLVAKYLNDKRVARISVANRTLSRAQELADEVGGRAMLLGEISQIMHEVDIVISSTASQLPIVGKGTIESALKKRRHNPMLLIDIAVPRDIEPEVAGLDDAYLYTVDDLARVVESNQQSRVEEVAEAQAIIESQVDEFMARARARESVSGISAYRQQAELWRDELLEKARIQLANGRPPEQVMEQMARGLTNKLLHIPTRNLQQMKESDLLRLTEELFQLPVNDEKSND